MTPKKKAVPAAQSAIPHKVYYIILVIVILIISGLRYRILDVPLERDEGEFAYIGKLILEGIPPFKEAYDQKLPGVYTMYAIIMALFGETSRGIHLGLLFTNIFSILFLFLAIRKVFNDWVGIITASAFGFLALTPAVLGHSAHATNFVICFALLGLWLFAKARAKKSFGLYFLSGLGLGVAFLMKQPGAFFSLFAVSILSYDAWKAGISAPIIKNFIFKALVLGAGILLPYLFTVFLMWRLGIFDKFWFWTYQYAIAYGTDWSVGWELLQRGIKILFSQFPGYWALAALGLGSLYWNRLCRPHFFYILSFFTFSFLAVCPGLIFREHYFILLLPAIGLLIGVAAQFLYEKTPLSLTLRLSLPLLLFVALTIQGIAKEKKYFLSATPLEISRTIYGLNPFPESLVIADYVKQITTPKDKIVVVGSEPQIYLYANRRAATGYIYTYGLVDGSRYNKPMIDEMIKEIETSKPVLLIFCSISASWGAQNKQSYEYYMNWLNEYVNQYYDVVGIADLVSADETKYIWGAQALEHQSQEGRLIYVLKRKPGL
jgi:4-amino-4-deoxy-L-arabinose transferase-like glycosyltransferase